MMDLMSCLRAVRPASRNSPFTTRMSLRWDCSTPVNTRVKNVQIILGLLEPCPKKEPKDTIKRKGMDTIIDLMRPRLVTAYTHRRFLRLGVQ
ncbi:hypothetical protein TNCV_2012021 [Trichonephila clavipes]|nr:hypothetical protein TNCV_2012021 [Trichonephila clavipes]